MHRSSAADAGSLNILLDLVSCPEMQSFQIVKICTTSGMYLGEMTVADGRTTPETSREFLRKAD
jgi:hypothetical protein